MWWDSLSWAEEQERLAKLSVKFVCAIPHDRKATAFRWTIFCKGGNDDEAPRPYRAKHFLHVGLTLFCGGEEVEDGPVMPDVVCMGRKLGFQNVCLCPLHLSRPLTEPGPGRSQRGPGQIKHGYVFIAMRQEIINES